MNWGKLYYSFSKNKGLLLPVFFVFLSISCDTPEGVLGASEDIRDAKKRGVYVAEYHVTPNPYIINDSLKLSVKEAWIEHQWFHTSSLEGASIKSDSYQLCINTSEDDLKGCNDSWTIGIDGNKYLHSSGRSSLLGDIDSPTDTIAYFVERGNGFIGDTLGNIIGRFIIVRK